MRFLLAALLVVTLAAPTHAAEGQMTWGVHISLAPTWFDPAEAASTVSQFITLYALHDAMVRPAAGQPLAPGLAESWTVSPDGLVFDFVLRKGVRFHNGETLTSDDVRYSFERYRGVAHKMVKDRVQAIETPDPLRVRIRLKQPWPDFMTFYAIATGAGWIVPRKYVEKVGDEGFKKAPVGAGPYRFVSFTPGVELVVDAFEQYWRKPPLVRRLVLRSIPDDATRVVALKRGEVDIAYAMRGALAQEVRRTPGLTLKPVVGQVTNWIYFAEQWDPKSPWHDRRVRLAANHAIDRQALNQAENLGFSRLTGSLIPASFEFYWQPPLYAFDLARARRLLAEAGYPNGFDAGEYFCDAAVTYQCEPVANDLNAVGIRTKLRPLERAAYFKGWSEKKYRGLIHGGSGAFGNAATRIESFVATGGAYVYGSYPDIDGLFREQATDLDPKRREATLHRIQQLMHEKVMTAPIWLNAGMNGVGRRVEEAGIGVIPGYIFSAPYEEVKLKAQ